MTCKDCIHYDACCKIGGKLQEHYMNKCNDVECDCFKDKSRFIELPCKVGDIVYRVIPKCDPDFGICPFDGGYGISRCRKDESGKYRNKCDVYIEEIPFSLYVLNNIGKTVFLTREEAEKKLQEDKE